MMRAFFILLLLTFPQTLWAQDKPANVRAQCAKGDLESCIDHAYFRGFEDKPKSFPASGVKALTRACKSKNSRACFALGSVHRDTPKSDLKKARESFERACELDRDPARTSGIGAAPTTDIHGQPNTPASCISVMEMDCALNGLEACQAWLTVAQRACPRRCAKPCDHVGLGGRPCCEEWTSDCEEARKIVDQELKKVGQTIANHCFDWKIIPKRLRVEVFVKPNQVVWSGVQDAEHQKEVACIAKELAALKFVRLPGPTTTRFMVLDGKPCDDAHPCDEGQSCVREICK